METERADSRTSRGVCILTPVRADALSALCSLSIGILFLLREHRMRHRPGQSVKTR